MAQLRYAPPPKTVDGLFAGPISVDAVRGTIAFDGATRTAAATAEIQFTVGAQAGYPTFDLQQDIESATLDGVAVPPADMAHHDFGGGANADLRVLERWLAAGSSHVLALSYLVGTPMSPIARGLAWEPGLARLSFEFFFSDLNPARYLESGLPSNIRAQLRLRVPTRRVPATGLRSTWSSAAMTVSSWAAYQSPSS